MRLTEHKATVRCWRQERSDYHTRLGPRPQSELGRSPSYPDRTILLENMGAGSTTHQEP